MPTTQTVQPDWHRPNLNNISTVLSDFNNYKYIRIKTINVLYTLYILTGINIEISGHNIWLLY